MGPLNLRRKTKDTFFRGKTKSKSERGERERERERGMVREIKR